jgi:hypothetical protein
MSASYSTQRPYDGTRYWVGNVTLRKSHAVMRTHSCPRRAPIWCMVRKPGMSASVTASFASVATMRGSVS